MHEGLTVSEAVEAFADAGPLPRAEAVKILQKRGLSRAGAYKRLEALENSRWLLRTPDGPVMNESLLNASPNVSTLDGETHD